MSIKWYQWDTKLVGYQTEARKNIECFNPLRAKLLRGIIYIYLYFMSLLHIDMTHILKILPQVRPGPTYSI